MDWNQDTGMNSPLLNPVWAMARERPTTLIRLRQMAGILCLLESPLISQLEVFKHGNFT